MVTNPSTDTSKIEKKMNIIISLLSKIANNGHDSTLKEQILSLASFGLSSSEIAGIVGKTVSHVSKELSISKKNN